MNPAYFCRGSSWARVAAAGRFAAPTSHASSNGSAREVPGPASSATTNIRSLPSAPRTRYRWASGAKSNTRDVFKSNLPLWKCLQVWHYWQLQKRPWQTVNTEYVLPSFIYSCFDIHVEHTEIPKTHFSGVTRCKVQLEFGFDHKLRKKIKLFELNKTFLFDPVKRKIAIFSQFLPSVVWQEDLWGESFRMFEIQLFVSVSLFLFWSQNKSDN